MRVRIQPRRNVSDLKKTLRAAGWRIVDDRDGILAEHPAVADTSDARIMLNDLGLLTASNIQIEFPLGEESGPS